MDRDITTMVRLAAVDLKLAERGFPLSRVGSHSLRAGGAVALAVNGASRDMIKKIGRWSSDTFLMYIHEQIRQQRVSLSAWRRRSHSPMWKGQRRPGDAKLTKPGDGGLLALAAGRDGRTGKGEGPSLTSFDCAAGRLPPAVGGPLGDLRSLITVGGRRGT